MQDAIGNEIKIGDKILQIDVGRGSCLVNKGIIEMIRGSRIYYQIWLLALDEDEPGRFGCTGWTTSSRIIRYEWNES